jgi:hypothetical protein
MMNSEKEPPIIKSRIELCTSCFELCTSCFSIMKDICCQMLLIIIVTIVYIKYNKDNYSDSLVYFTFGTFIAIYVVATIVLLIKREIIVDKLIKKINVNSCSVYRIIFLFINFFFKDSKQIRQIITYVLYHNILLHILFTIIACYYVKSYIIHSKKTDYAYLVSLWYAILFLLFNIYVMDIYKRYNRKIMLSTNETTIIILSLFIIYAILLYYFETIKLTETS